MDLRAEYLGLTLNTPFVVGAGPGSDDVAVARGLQDAGAGALVMRSLFEEQIAPPPPGAAGDVADTFPGGADYQMSPDGYLRQIERLKRQLSIPVIASLNGHETGSLAGLAGRVERAGADAIELNFYQVVADPGIAADEVELEILRVTGAVVAAVKIPVAVKLSPFHTSVAQLAVALEFAGAAGVVIFNRFFQPDIDVDELEARPVLRLTEPAELLLRLRWLAILSPLLRGSLAAAGGVASARDAAKAMLCGAHVVQLVSVLLRHGPEVLLALARGLEGWMGEHGFSCLDDFRGRLNLSRCRDASAFERANYVRTVHSWRA